MKKLKKTKIKKGFFEFFNSYVTVMEDIIGSIDRLIRYNYDLSGLLDELIALAKETESYDHFYEDRLISYQGKIVKERRVVSSADGFMLRVSIYFSHNEMVSSLVDYVDKGERYSYYRSIYVNNDEISWSYYEDGSNVAIAKPTKTFLNVKSANK